jgi:hypothetical protein
MRRSRGGERSEPRGQIKRSSNHDPLEANFIAPAIVELRRARRGVVRYDLAMTSNGSEHQRNPAAVLMQNIDAK